MHQEAPAFAEGGAQAFGAFGAARRLVVIALRNGVEHFQSHPRLWRHLLDGVPSDQVDQVATYFAATPPAIIAGYPRAQMRTDQIAVIKSAEEAVDEVLGDFVGFGVDTLGAYDAGDALELRGAVHRKRLQVMVITRHPDIAEVLDAFVVATLRAHSDWLAEHGVRDLSYMGGGELAPDLRFLPAECYVQGSDWSCLGVAALPLPTLRPPRRLWAFLETATPEGITPGVEATTIITGDT